MSYPTGQLVCIKSNRVIGKIVLKLPLQEVYLVQWPGFPVVEKLYYGSDLERAPETATETRQLQHAHV